MRVFDLTRVIDTHPLGYSRLNSELIKSKKDLERIKWRTGNTL